MATLAPPKPAAAPSASSGRPATEESDLSPTPTPLHLAVKVARASAIPIVLGARPSELNTRDPAGQTALHIACALGRADIVAVLLAQADIDDMVRDVDGRTCLECCKSPETARLIQVSRAQFNATYASKLLDYMASPPSPEDPATASSPAREALVGWIGKNRSRCLDYSAKVGAPGTAKSNATTVMHEAARRRDVPLLELCYAKGADMLARDGKGKAPSDVTKDDKVRAFLKQSA